MKLGILTLARADSYGEILQNYALVLTLKELGHEPTTIDFQWRAFKSKRSWEYSTAEKLYFLMRNIARKCIKPYKKFRSSPTFEEWCIITKELREFEKKYIPMTEFISDLRHEDQLESYKFEGYVVGSDQVWRPSLVDGHLRTFFLDFIAEDSPVKRVAYGACWGTREWAASNKAKGKCALLAKRFDAISVRQESSVQICKDTLGVNVEWVLDPTLLRVQDDYRSLLRPEHEMRTSGNILEVFLNSLQKEQFSQLLSQKLKKPIIKFMPYFFSQRKDGDTLSKFTFPSIESWISAFANADFVITDSFHGMCFCLIFEKPFFVTLGEEAFGRFEYISRLLDIEDRIFTIKDFKRFKNSIDTNQCKMNYDSIRERLSVARKSSIAFLQKNLKN